VMVISSLKRKISICVTSGKFVWILVWWWYL